MSTFRVSLILNDWCGIFDIQSSIQCSQINSNQFHYYRKFPIHFAWQTDQEWDSEMTEHLHQEFALHGLDKVEIFNYNVVASSPNPASPSQLELTDSQDQVKLNVQLKSLIADEKESGSNSFYNVYSSQSVDNFFKVSSW